MALAEDLDLRSRPVYQPGVYALRDTWFPIAFDNTVRARPIRRMLHGEPVFLWREGERVVAARSARGSADRRIGRSTSIDDGGFYVTVQRYGYVWVWYGDPARASSDLVPNIPVIPPQGTPARFQKEKIIDCSYELLTENVLDLTHAEFLHSNFAGAPMSEDDVVEVESTSETVTMTRLVRKHPMPAMQRLVAPRAQTQDIRVVSLNYVRSGVTVITVDMNPGIRAFAVHPVVPESPTRCRLVLTFYPRMAGWAGSLLVAALGIPLRQDNWALRAQNPNYLDGQPRRDLSSRFDKAGLRFRKVYESLVARQIDGDYSYSSDGHPARDIRAELHVDERV